MSLPVKEFRKSVNIWGSYGQEFGVLFFSETQCTKSGSRLVTTMHFLFHFPQFSHKYPRKYRGKIFMQVSTMQASQSTARNRIDKRGYFPQSECIHARDTAYVIINQVIYLKFTVSYSKTIGDAHRQQWALRSWRIPPIRRIVDFFITQVSIKCHNCKNSQ